jgi:hypothetical protein
MVEHLERSRVMSAASMAMQACAEIAGCLAD